MIIALDARYAKTVSKDAIVELRISGRRPPGGRAVDRLEVAESERK